MAGDFFVTNERGERAPEIHERCYEILPASINGVLGYLDYRHERELFLISTLCALGACCNLAHALYDRKMHAPYLFFAATGVFGTGKSAIMLPYKFLSAIDFDFRDDYKKLYAEYAKELRKYERQEMNRKDDGDDGNAPEKPKENLLLLSTDITAAMMFERLNRAEQCAALYICDEAGTLINSINSKYGKYTNFLCQAFDGSNYSFERKFGGDGNMERSYTLRNVRLGVSIAGTPEVLKPFFSENFNNGLFSRFFHYRLPIVTEHLPPAMDGNLDKYLREEATVEAREWVKFVRAAETVMTIPRDLTNYFTEHFLEYKPEKMSEYGAAFGGISNRQAVMGVRLITIIALLRCFKGRFADSPPSQIKATAEDVDVAIEILMVLRWYMEDAYTNYVMESKHVETDSAPLALGQMLVIVESEFNTADWQEAAKMVGVSERTARNFLKNAKFIKKKAHGLYEKI